MGLRENMTKNNHQKSNSIDQQFEIKKHIISSQNHSILEEDKMIDDEKFAATFEQR